MSQAEDLLTTLSETTNIHAHGVNDSDAYFVIDPRTRVIDHPIYETIVLMQNDHNSSCLTFELPRYIDGHDMMLCTAVKVHYNNIASDAYTENEDVADLHDLRVNPANTSKVICSWTISRQATQLVGTLNFLLQYLCADSEGNETYEFHTDIYSSVEVRQGRNNGPAAIIEYTDILEQWRARLFGAKDSLLTDLVAASEEQQAAIVAKGKATLDTIPEDYTTTHAMAEEACRRNANAIVVNVSGETMAIDDASNNYIQDLKVYGRTEQFTTTGKNVLDLSAFEFDDSEYIHSFVYSGTGDGVATANALFNFLKANVGQTVTLSAEVTGTMSGVEIGSIRFYDANNALLYIIVPGKSLTIESKNADFTTCYVYGSTNGATVKHYQLEYGTEVTDYEPYTGGKASPSLDYPQELMSIENPTVYIGGKNLFDMSAIANTDTITKLDDGTISVSNYFNPTQKTLQQLAPGLTAGMTCRLSMDTDGVAFIYLTAYGQVWDADDVLILNEDIMNSPVSIYGKSSQTDSSAIIRNIQIAVTDFSLDIEPYRVTQSVTFTHILRAIPVSSGGNYTDATGQHWIADYVDCERKELVQNCYEETLQFGYQSELDRYTATVTHKANQAYANDNGIPILCRELQYNPACGGGTPVINGIRIAATSPYYVIAYHNGEVIHSATIIYPLAEPIITPLTDAEVLAYKSLRTNRVNTTITNDSNARMEVSYAADTETYINNNYVSKSVMEDVLNRLAVLEAAK